ncbi:respiratory nitrate reductase subunit gamma [Nocardia jejuensis]|uniref:respiratory nitrate reductase subunit gamma n=1 Tax=Nocardia jejuensis TaxID=328049 RepID=UPI0008324E1B|nr:respiratory nitrate reductase subunit gamma [Nocardia jejuensis]
MMYALWVVLPCAAVLSCVVGHMWRYRHDRFLGALYGPHTDSAQIFGIRTFRVGALILLSVRITEVIASGPHSRPAPSIQSLLVTLQFLAVPMAIVGAGLILIPPLIAADIRSRVTPLDRATLPIVVAAMVSAVLVAFDPTSTDSRYRTAETLFTWVRSLVTLHPEPEVMQHAPVLYQCRGIIIMILIAIWPYTRLAGIFTIPSLQLLRRLPRLTRPRDPVPG